MPRTAALVENAVLVEKENVLVEREKEVKVWVEEIKDGDMSPTTQSGRYKPPMSGFNSKLPAAWVPYAELMRIERPAGLYAFYFPYLIGLAYAACIAEPIVPSLEHVVALSALFLVWNIILRGAACAWNDNMDQEFDRQVTRCRNRPIARGAVTTAQGHVFTAVLCLSLVPILAFFPASCTYHTGAMLLLFGLYALAKRVTYYPQVVLGFPFAWAIFFCCAALQVDPFGPGVLLPTASLFSANVLWTISYDTIYAHQDVRDDVKAGVKSMAVRFAHSTKLLVVVLSIAQVSLLILTGWLTAMSPAYFIGTCAGTAIALGSMVVRVNLSEPSSCAWWFHGQFWFVGGSMASGLFGDFVLRVCAH